MKILVAGFERFPGVDSNPTETGVRSVDQWAKTNGSIELVAEVLPVEFESAGRRIVELVDQVKPSAVICFGVAAGSPAFLLERCARNMNDAVIPDNAGAMPSTQVIVPSGPATYSSSLPLNAIHHQLQKADFPVAFSDDAGAYVCNHVFYVACHELAVRSLQIPCGFIHVPLPVPPEMDDGASTDSIVEAMKICVMVTEEELRRRNPSTGEMLDLA